MKARLRNGSIIYGELAKRFIAIGIATEIEEDKKPSDDNKSENKVVKKPTPKATTKKPIAKKKPATKKK